MENYQEQALKHFKKYIIISIILREIFHSFHFLYYCDVNE